VQIEEDVLETPPAEEVSTLGDEILDFYQPDEDLKLEDLIADLDVLSPEQAMGLKELQSQVQTELNGLPRKWKRALVLRYVDGLTGPDLASALGVKAAEAERTLKYAGACLRERLLEAGFSTWRMA
jgi:DNA-directed RNA polymerase specialized sigma24 family protein